MTVSSSFHLFKCHLRNIKWIQITTLTKQIRFQLWYFPSTMKCSRMFFSSKLYITDQGTTTKSYQVFDILWPNWQSKNIHTVAKRLWREHFTYQTKAINIRKKQRWKIPFFTASGALALLCDLICHVRSCFMLSIVRPCWTFKHLANELNAYVEYE